MHSNKLMVLLSLLAMAPSVFMAFEWDSRSKKGRDQPMVAGANQSVGVSSSTEPVGSRVPVRQIFGERQDVQIGNDQVLGSISHGGTVWSLLQSENGVTSVEKSQNSFAATTSAGGSVIVAHNGTPNQTALATRIALSDEHMPPSTWTSDANGDELAAPAGSSTVFVKFVVPACADC